MQLLSTYSEWFCKIWVDTLLDLAQSIPLSACPYTVQPTEDKKKLSDCICSGVDNEMIPCIETLIEFR